MDTPSERRKYPRSDITCRLRIELPNGRDLRTRSLNVSDGGVYFVTDEEVVDLGREMTVRLSVPRDTANTFFLEQFAAKARVIRRDPSPDGYEGVGVALKFEKVLALDLL
jgi:c-di-GMP-binding flagellar brake protein YcgR